MVELEETTIEPKSIKQKPGDLKIVLLMVAGIILLALSVKLFQLAEKKITQTAELPEEKFSPAWVESCPSDKCSHRFVIKLPASPSLSPKEY